MNETISVAEALVLLAKECIKMKKSNTLNEKMNEKEALDYLDLVVTLTRDNEVAWTDESYTHMETEYDESEERYVLYHEKVLAVLKYQVRSGVGEVFNLYVESPEGSWYLFDNKYLNDIINIYNWMTIEYEEGDSRIIDAEYSVVDDNKPFEFVVNTNYNFETLG